MDNALLTTDGRPLADVERKIRKYLPGLDVHLWPVGSAQAVLRAPLIRAIETDYPRIGVRPLLAVMGVARVDAIDDETAANLVSLRDTDRLLPRRRAAVPRAAPGAVDWHLAQARAPEAWALWGGADHIDWGDVRVGQIDTGYTAHPAFGFPQGNWVREDLARSFRCAPLPDEWSAEPEERGPGQDNLIGLNGGHGTRIGAAICGHAPDAPQRPFHGAAPRVPLVPARITDSVWINHRQREFREATRYLVREAGVRVINVSLGVFMGKATDDLRDAVNEAYDAGVIMVCAAGNIVNPVVAPARLSRTLAVGGVTADNRPWSGSSYGPETDISAYADGIRRAHPRLNGRFEYADGGDGTSYATAMTSGTAALWLAWHADALAAAYPQAWQRVEAFRAAVQRSARVPDGWQPGAFGTGILDMAAALQQPLPDAASLQAQPRA